MLGAELLEHVRKTARGLKPWNDHEIVDAVIAIYNLCVGTVCRQTFCHFFLISRIWIKISVFLLCIRVFQRDKLNKLQRVGFMRQNSDVFMLKILYHTDIGRSIKVAIMLVCIFRHGGFRVSPPPPPAAGSPPYRRLDVNRIDGWTSAAAAARRPPSRWLEVRRPGDWTCAAPAAGCLLPRRLDVGGNGGWTFAVPIYYIYIYILLRNNKIYPNRYFLWLYLIASLLRFLIYGDHVTTTLTTGFFSSCCLKRLANSRPTTLNLTL